jgi:hypothetical protein
MLIVKTTLKDLNEKLATIKLENGKTSTVPKVCAVKKFPTIHTSREEFNKILQLISGLGKILKEGLGFYIC